MISPIPKSTLGQKSIKLGQSQNEQSNNGKSKNNSSFVEINNNLNQNQVYIPAVVSRENFYVQLKIEEEANRTLQHMKSNKINQNKLERDIKLTYRKDRSDIIDRLKSTSKDFNK